MKKLRKLFLFFCLLTSSTLHTSEPTLLQNEAHKTYSVKFTPPPGWRFAEANALPPKVKVMVVGKGSYTFPPSMNLGVGSEHFTGTLKEYLKRVKSINDAKGIQWKSLGTLQTEAGTASLSQADMHNEWGDVRMMHAMIKYDDKIYILTAASLKDEFPVFYKDFFNALKSLRIEHDGSSQKSICLK